MVTVELIPGGSTPPDVSYVVIATRYEGGWLFVKHRRRGGWEMPAGHRKPGEDTVVAAVRELTEETGATEFIMEPVSYYSVDTGDGRQYGRLFCAVVERMGAHTDTDEIEEVRIFRRLPRNLSLQEVMSFLYKVARQHNKGLKV